MMGKQGLISGIIAIVVILFAFAVFSALALYMWNSANNTFQSMDNETINAQTKVKINDLSDKFLWADKVFMLFYIILLIGYIMSALVTPTESPIYLFIFLFLLIIVTIVSMMFSNAWTWIIGNTLSSVSGDLTYTNYFMKNLPIISFFTGIIGGALFYMRSRTGVGNVAGFE